MATENKFIVCSFCDKGQLIRSSQELDLQQWTDKGYIYFRAAVPIGVCNLCGRKSFGPGAEQVLDEAFQREYKKKA